MKNFEQYVAKCWDTLMDADRWGQWNEYETGDADILLFATEIARTAFADGAQFGTTSRWATCGDMLKEVDKRYPLPKPVVEYRTAGPDSQGNCWQVRDGIAWGSAKGAEFKRHIEVSKVLQAMSRLEQYGDVALLASLAANPTED